MTTKIAEAETLPPGAIEVRPKNGNLGYVSEACGLGKACKSNSPGTICGNYFFGSDIQKGEYCRTVCLPALDEAWKKHDTVIMTMDNTGVYRISMPIIRQ